jgi:hypothetical protein
MSLKIIGQQLLATRDRLGVLLANALDQIDIAFSNTYRDMGWFRINKSQSGLKKDLLVTPQLNVTAANNETVAGRIYSEAGALIIELVDVRSFTVRDRLLIPSVLIVSGSIQIYAPAPYYVSIAELQGNFNASTGDYSTGLFLRGGVTAGQLAVLTADITKDYADLTTTFVDPVDGDATVFQHLTAAGGVSVEYTKGADNAVRIAVGNTIVTFSVENISHTTTVKPESVSTSRLGVGTTPPTVDGYAVVNDFLGAASSAPSATEKLRVGGNARVDANLGIGMNPTRPLDVTGDAKITGTLEVDSAATFDSTVTITPLASGDLFVGQVSGTLSTISPSTARFALDVYSKAEVDAAIAAAIAAIVVDNALVGTPEEHNHSLS